MMLLAFAMKSPVPLLCLVAFAFWRLAATREISDAEWLCALVFAVLMTLFSYLKGISVGLRYVLPAYPFLHVLASRSLREGAKLPAWGRIALAGLAIWYVVGALRIHPDYLAHFNELVGGPDNGHRLLADSNLDWGQDLPALKRYVDEQGIERIRLAYFGAGHAPHHGIEYEYLPSIGLDPLEPGEQSFWHGVELPPLDLSRGPMAVSATLVAGVFLPGYYAPLAELEPVAQIGHSILIYGPHQAEETP